jgi:hypothetical protein
MDDAAPIAPIEARRDGRAADFADFADHPEIMERQPSPHALTPPVGPILSHYPSICSIRAICG